MTLKAIFFLIAYNPSTFAALYYLFSLPLTTPNLLLFCPHYCSKGKLIQNSCLSLGFPPKKVLTVTLELRWPDTKINFS